MAKNRNRRSGDLARPVHDSGKLIDLSGGAGAAREFDAVRPTHLGRLAM